METTVIPRRVALAFALACVALAPLAANAQADKAVTHALEGYFDFADENGGTFLPEQIPAEDYPKFFVLDVRDAGQFTKEHVPGAVNIEWRQVFAQRARLLYGGFNEWKARGGMQAYARAGRKD